MSHDPCPADAEELLELAKQLRHKQREEAALRAEVRHLDKVVREREDLEERVRRKLLRLDLAPGNSGWERRIAFLIGEVARQAEEDE